MISTTCHKHIYTFLSQCACVWAHIIYNNYIIISSVMEHLGCEFTIYGHHGFLAESPANVQLLELVKACKYPCTCYPSEDICPSPLH